MSHKYKVVDKRGREYLTEGRRRGISFAFCKRDGDTFNCIHPISACKDYLNDIVYTESTGVSVGFYGLNTHRQSIFDGVMGYLAMKVLPYFHVKTLSVQDMADIKNVTDNTVGMVKFMNLWEDHLDIKGRTEIHNCEENMWVVFVPYWWCEVGWRISLYCLLLRNSYSWKGEALMDFLKHKNNPDYLIFNTSMDKIERVYKKDPPPATYPDAGTRDVYGDYDDSPDVPKFDIHNTGIQSIHFPVKKASVETKKLVHV